MKVKTNLSYFLTVINTGPAAATQGSCSGAPLMTCNMGTLASGVQLTVTIVVKPTKTGKIVNTAPRLWTEHRRPPPCLAVIIIRCKSWPWPLTVNGFGLSHPMFAVVVLTVVSLAAI
ncbi:MAG: hypothetical protein WC213_00340 [Arenimonas sp.]